MAPGRARGYLRGMSVFKVPDWLYSDRDLEQTAANMIESGGMRLAVDYGSGWEDCTDSDLVRTKDRLQKMDWLITVLEGLAHAKGT